VSKETNPDNVFARMKKEHYVGNPNLDFPEGVKRNGDLKDVPAFVPHASQMRN
jgi:hypothetical protein